MKEKVKEIIENNNLTKKQFLKAMEELNISDIEAIRILTELYEESCEKALIFIYEEIYKESVLRGKTDIEILTESINAAKIKAKKINQAVIFNYLIVGYTGLNTYLGYYDLLYEKILGIATLASIAYNHYNYTRRKKATKGLLIHLYRVKETLPKLRCTTKNSQK